MGPKPRAWHGLSVNGVLTRSVIDSALFYDVASGSIDSDLDRPPAPPVSFVQAAGTPPGPLRIAYSKSVPFGVISKLDGDAFEPADGAGLGDASFLVLMNGETAPTEFVLPGLALGERWTIVLDTRGRSRVGDWSTSAATIRLDAGSLVVLSDREG